MGKRSKPTSTPPIGSMGALTHNPFAGMARIGSEPAQTPVVLEGSKTPFAAKVVVRRETKGRGGKTVTRISGVHAEHRDAIATRMKRDLGCGATIEEGDLLLLGSLVDRAADWLEADGARNVVRAN